jgi:acyl-coenzyme A thioesterase PaaI-like protein
LTKRTNDIYAQSMRTQHITWDKTPKSGASRLLLYWRARPLHPRAPPAHRAHALAQVQITTRDNQQNICAERTRTRHIAQDKVPISGPGRGLPYWRARPLQPRAPPAHRAHAFAEMDITTSDRQHNICAGRTRTRHIAQDKVPISDPGKGLP